MVEEDDVQHNLLLEIPLIWFIGFKISWFMSTDFEDMNILKKIDR